MIFVQIRAKLTGLLTFALALCYCAYAYGRLNPLNTLVFFVSMAAFELSITGFNNYMDSRKNPEMLPFSRRLSLGLLIIFWAVAVIFGVILVFNTDAVVLACGAACFFTGTVYSFGPVPISHTPLGELFSGVFEGFFILLLVVYINAPPDSLIGFSWNAGAPRMVFYLLPLAGLALLSAPCVACVANIMLANNICDIEKDELSGRHTLPCYLGKKRSLRLFAALYYAAFAAEILAAACGVVPAYALFALFALFFVQRNITAFFRAQDKSTTFLRSINNMVWIILPLTACVGAAAIMRL